LLVMDPGKIPDSGLKNSICDSIGDNSNKKNICN